MSFYELFKKGHQTRNKAHFASIASIAMTDGKISEDEQNLLQTLAIKLGVNKSDMATILKNPAQYPIVPSNSADERLERMHDLFDMIFSDQKIDAKELVLIKKYAIGLGYNSSSANELIQDSIEIYTGKISYNEYKYLIKNRLKKWIN
tara:strand:+ start:452 stop:895 length:444 start_codon:yes stop_codon:yes gene_type:complete